MTAARVRWTGARAVSDRGTPLQALAGWAGALAVGVGCWAGVAACVGRVL